MTLRLYPSETEWAAYEADPAGWTHRLSFNGRVVVYSPRPTTLVERFFPGLIRNRLRREQLRRSRRAA